MDEQTIHSRISALVDQEHALRAGVGSGELAADDERIRLQRVEEELDQCWDLLRQRAANSRAPIAAHHRRGTTDSVRQNHRD